MKNKTDIKLRFYIASVAEMKSINDSDMIARQKYE